jgi:hypothetical protein
MPISLSIIHGYFHTATGNRDPPIWQNKGKKTKTELVGHAYNPSNQEAEAGGFLISKPAWAR